MVWWFWLLFLLVLLVLLVLVVLVVSHNIPEELFIIFFDFHQVSNNFRHVHLIIFLLMSLDFRRLSAGPHTPTITAQTVLPGIVEATPRLATPCHAPSSKPLKSHASHHATPPTRVMQDPTSRRNLSTQVFLVNC
jgi:hypothetical protein